MKRLTGLLFVAMLAAGCQTRMATNTPRSAIEQMLLSGAVDAALEKLTMPGVVGKTVYLEFANLKAYDVEYIKVATRARFAQLGAVLVDDAGVADLVVEVASGALGIEYKSSVVGIPPLPMPNSPIATPALPFFSGREQTGIVKLLFFVRAKGEYVSAYHTYAKCDREESHLLGIRFNATDDIRTRWEQADAALEASTPALAGN